VNAKPYLVLRNRTPDGSGVSVTPRMARGYTKSEERVNNLSSWFFEGRTYRSWAHHTVLTAAAFAFLQLERGRALAQPRSTLPCVRAWMWEIAALLSRGACDGRGCTIGSLAENGARRFRMVRANRPAALARR
jgi:hypothetical protein